MRIMIRNNKKYEARKRSRDFMQSRMKWKHQWFAWRPVVIKDRDDNKYISWLEVVWREVHSNIWKGDARKYFSYQDKDSPFPDRLSDPLDK